MNDCLIREMDEDMLEKCVAVIHEGFGTVAAEFGLTQQNCPTNAAFMTRERLAEDMQKGNLMYGLYVARKLAGFMQLEKKADAQIELKNVTVLPRFQHLGLGGRLLDFACDKARQLGGDKIVIGIIEENTVLKNWYLRHGFVHTGTAVLGHLPFAVGFMHLKLKANNHDA